MQKSADSTIFFFQSNRKFGELSNFFRLNDPIIYMGERYDTSEHLYQAMKFLEAPTQVNLEFAMLIRNESTPYRAKLLANQGLKAKYLWQMDIEVLIEEYKKRGAQPCDLTDTNKIAMMKKCLALKFGSDTRCMSVLMSTGTRNIIEYSHYDKFWGQRAGKGKNMMGILLMELRNSYCITPYKMTNTNGLMNYYSDNICGRKRKILEDIDERYERELKNRKVIQYSYIND
jgi:ribA/ribD-fused uncharacterized protein